MSEPNPNMDELLKRYVEQRREESRAEFELHPATRKLLQGEVARVFPESNVVKKKSFIFLLWPRLAFVGIFTALLAVTVLVLNTPNDRRLEVAQNSSKELASTAPAPMAPRAESPLDSKNEAVGFSKQKAPATPPASRTTASVADSEIADRGAMAPVAAEEKMETRRRDVSSIDKKVEPVIAKEIPAKKSVDSSGGTRAETFAGKSDFSARSSLVVTESPIALSDEIDTSHRWQFVQEDLRAKYRRNLLSPAQPKVLQSFALVQIGNKIRLLDGDGSVYEGELLTVAQDKSGEYGLSRSDNSQFSFRVVGTNSLLQSEIRFTGKFTPTTAQLGLTQKSAERLSGTAATELEKKQAVIPIGTLEGKVSVGGTNEFEIRATTVPLK